MTNSAIAWLWIKILIGTVVTGFCGCSVFKPDMRADWYVKDGTSNPLTSPMVYVYFEYFGKEPINNPHIILNAPCKSGCDLRWRADVDLDEGWVLEAPPTVLLPYTVYTWPLSRFERGVGSKREYFLLPLVPKAIPASSPSSDPAPSESNGTVPSTILVAQPGSVGCRVPFRIDITVVPTEQVATQAPIAAGKESDRVSKVHGDMPRSLPPFQAVSELSVLCVGEPLP